MNTFSPTDSNNTLSNVRRLRKCSFVLFWAFHLVVLAVTGIGFSWNLFEPWGAFIGISAWASQVYVGLFWAMSVRKRSPEITYWTLVVGGTPLCGLACCFIIPFALLLLSHITMVHTRYINQSNKFQLSLQDACLLMLSTIFLAGFMRGVNQYVFGSLGLQVSGVNIQTLGFIPGRTTPWEIGQSALGLLEVMLVFFPFGAMWACFGSSHVIKRILLLKWLAVLTVSLLFIPPTTMPPLFLIHEVIVLTFGSVLVVSFLLFRGMGYQLSTREEYLVLPINSPPDLSFLKDEERHRDKPTET